MKTTHTPAEWGVAPLLDLPDDYYLEEMIGDANGHILAVTVSIPRGCGYEIESTERKANARLIAAAPEMLAALIHAENELFLFKVTCNAAAHREVRLAIAKATGAPLKLVIF